MVCVCCLKTEGSSWNARGHSPEGTQTEAEGPRSSWKGHGSPSGGGPPLSGCCSRFQPFRRELWGHLITLLGKMNEFQVLWRGPEIFDLSSLIG